jgi:hypothetical protein
LSITALSLQSIGQPDLFTGGGGGGGVFAARLFLDSSLDRENIPAKFHSNLGVFYSIFIALLLLNFYEKRMRKNGTEYNKLLLSSFSN